MKGVGACLILKKRGLEKGRIIDQTGPEGKFKGTGNEILSDPPSIVV